MKKRLRVDASIRGKASRNRKGSRDRSIGNIHLDDGAFATFQSSAAPILTAATDAQGSES